MARDSRGTSPNQDSPSEFFASDSMNQSALGLHQPMRRCLDISRSFGSVTRRPKRQAYCGLETSSPDAARAFYAKLLKIPKIRKNIRFLSRSTLPREQAWNASQQSPMTEDERERLHS